MDDTVLKIALAGLLHDIGKFAEEGGSIGVRLVVGNKGDSNV